MQTESATAPRSCKSLRDTEITSVSRGKVFLVTLILTFRRGLTSFLRYSFVLTSRIFTDRYRWTKKRRKYLAHKQLWEFKTPELPGR